MSYVETENGPICPGCAVDEERGIRPGFGIEHLTLEEWDHGDHDGAHGYCEICGESICPQSCQDEADHYRREYERIGHLGKDYFSRNARDFPEGEIRALRATGSWCEEHGALFLGQACKSCSDVSDWLSLVLSATT